MEAITEVYESGWSGHDLLYVQAQNLEMLWQDFSHKLGDQVLIPLNTYTNQFPEVRVRDLHKNIDCPKKANPTWYQLIYQFMLILQKDCTKN